jgi:ATP-dependent Clp protease ATP-binding subunit ClpB
MIRFDMSEYMEAHSVSKLIGSPPGYIGYDEGGQLTEAVRRQPYALLLFDEIEKAHRDIFNLLLQIMDEGRLTDNQGRTVDFKNTLLILTSNIGSEFMLSKEEGAPEKVMDLVKKQFKPEFLNRLDEIIMFNPLHLKLQIEIAEKMLNELSLKLQTQHIHMNFHSDVIKYVIQHGYQEEYGARPLKRFIQRHIETLIATELISNLITPNTPYVMLIDNQKLVIRPQ